MVSSGNMSIEGFLEAGRGRGDSTRRWPKTMQELALGWTGHLDPSPTSPPVKLQEVRDEQQDPCRTAPGKGVGYTWGQSAPETGFQEAEREPPRKNKGQGEWSRAGHTTGWGVSEEHREEAREGGALWQRGGTEDAAEESRDRWVHFFLRSSKDDK